MINPNQWEEEMLERFWNALIPMVVRETRSEVIREIEKEVEELGYDFGEATGQETLEAVLSLLTRLKDQETK